MTDQEKLLKLHAALKRIASYQSTTSLHRNSQGEFGLPYEEALEMAYENIQHEAKAAIKGMRLSKVKS